MSTLLTETPRRSALKRRLAEDEETPKKKVSFSPQPTTVHEIPLIGRRRLPPRKLYDAGADSPKTTPVRRRSHTEILGEAGTSAESSSIPTSPTLVKQPSATTQKFTGTPAKATPRKLVQAGANSPKAALGEAGASAEGSSSPTPPASAQRPTATARISTGTPIFLPDLTGPSAAKKPRVTSTPAMPKPRASVTAAKTNTYASAMMPKLEAVEPTVAPMAMPKMNSHLQNFMQALHQHGRDPSSNMITLTNQFGHQQQITPLHYHLEGVRMLDSYITTYTGMISHMVDGMRSFKNQLNLTSPLPLAIKHQPE